MALVKRSPVSCVLLVAVALANGEMAPGQDTPKPEGTFRSLEDLRANYERRVTDLERERLASLDTLASAKSGKDADAVYRELFLRAIDHDLCSEARVAAERCLSKTGHEADVRALATLVAANAKAEDGQIDQAIDRFRALVAERAKAAAPDSEPLLAVGEIFLRKLLRAGRYEPARRFCTMLAKGQVSPEVSAHFAAEQRLLSVVGQPAPAIETTDVDGRRFRLADFKGKVVLITFWASWCPPCLAEFPQLNALAEKYEAQGLELLGVNLDAHHEGVKDVKTATPIVRHALVHHGVMWPNVLNDDGTDGDIARAYGVSTVPSNVLIGADGKVLGVSITAPELETVITKALPEGAK